MYLLSIYLFLYIYLLFCFCFCFCLFYLFFFYLFLFIYFFNYSFIHAFIHSFGVQEFLRSQDTAVHTIYMRAQRRLRSACAGSVLQADLSLHWVHMPFCRHWCAQVFILFISAKINVSIKGTVHNSSFV